MQRIHQQDLQDSSLADKVLSWIDYTVRPLTVLELQYALAFDTNLLALDEEALPDPGLLVSVCAGLVVIDPHSHIIRLVHHTAQEYFERRRTDHFPDAPEKIAATCVNYLMAAALIRDHPPPEVSISDEQRELYPFLHYAARYWGLHICQIDDPMVRERVTRSLVQHNKVRTAIDMLAATKSRNRILARQATLERVLAR